MTQSELKLAAREAKKGATMFPKTAKRLPELHWKIIENLMSFWVPESPPRGSKMPPETPQKITLNFDVFLTPKKEPKRSPKGA